MVRLGGNSHRKNEAHTENSVVPFDVDLTAGWYAGRSHFSRSVPLASLHAVWRVACLKRVKDTLRLHVFQKTKKKSRERHFFFAFFTADLLAP